MLKILILCIIIAALVALFLYIWRGLDRPAHDRKGHSSFDFDGV
jgi:hypothetical protein